MLSFLHSPTDFRERQDDVASRSWNVKCYFLCQCYFSFVSDAPCMSYVCVISWVQQCWCGWVSTWEWSGRQCTGQGWIDSASQCLVIRSQSSCSVSVSVGILNLSSVLYFPAWTNHCIAWVCWCATHLLCHVLGSSCAHVNSWSHRQPCTE